MLVRKSPVVRVGGGNAQSNRLSSKGFDRDEKVLASGDCSMLGDQVTVADLVLELLTGHLFGEVDVAALILRLGATDNGLQS
jgi:hypothetical protein